MRLRVISIGALQKTPNNMLNGHVGLEPIDVRIQCICMTAAVRIVTLPATHPLQRLAEKAAVFVKCHRAPLHYLIRVLGEHPRKVGTIDIVCCLLEWKCLARVIVGETVEEAIKRERSNEADVRVYTDRSGH